MTFKDNFTSSLRWIVFYGFWNWSEFVQFLLKPIMRWRGMGSQGWHFRNRDRGIFCLFRGSCVEICRWGLRNLNFYFKILQTLQLTESPKKSSSFHTPVARNSISFQLVNLLKQHKRDYYQIFTSFDIIHFDLTRQ